MMTCLATSCDDKWVNREVELNNKTKGTLTDCQECNGKGVIFKAVWDDNVGYWACVGSKCKCKKIYDVKRRIKQSGLEKLINEKTFETYQTTNQTQCIAKTKAMNYDSGWFYIGGQSGFGKTHLCTAIVAKKIEHGISALYMPWMDLIGELKRKYYAENFDQEIKKYKTAKLLYIDDLFKVKSLDAQNIEKREIDIAYDIINHRYNNDLDTIISSEFTLQELYNFDNAIGGRIKEKCKDNFVGISKDSNNNWRLKAR